MGAKFYQVLGILYGCNILCLIKDEMVNDLQYIMFLFFSMFFSFVHSLILKTLCQSIY